MADENKIQAGEIIWHSQYGFGIMKELPTFGNMQVTGIRNECIIADSLVKDLHQQLSSLKASMDILKELVECKNLSTDSRSYMKTDHYYAYLRRFETAWEQARKVIAGEEIKKPQ